MHLFAQYTNKHVPCAWSGGLATYLLPGAGAVGLARPVNGRLELPEVHQRGGQPAEVGHVVVQQLGRVVHLVVVATVAHLRTRTRGEEDERRRRRGSGRGVVCFTGG